jgi:hypothetical protein
MRAARTTLLRGLLWREDGATMGTMHVAFVVHLVKGADPEQVLSDEIKRATQAVVMSLDDAKKMGFSVSGVKATPDRDVGVIVVSRNDANWIQRTLDQSDLVAGFQTVDVALG